MRTLCACLHGAPSPFRRQVQRKSIKNSGLRVVWRTDRCCYIYGSVRKDRSYSARYPSNTLFILTSPSISSHKAPTSGKRSSSAMPSS